MFSNVSFCPQEKDQTIFTFKLLESDKLYLFASKVFNKYSITNRLVVGRSSLLHLYRWWKAKHLIQNDSDMIVRQIFLKFSLLFQINCNPTCSGLEPDWFTLQVVKLLTDLQSAHFGFSSHISLPVSRPAASSLPQVSEMLSSWRDTDVLLVGRRFLFSLVEEGDRACSVGLTNHLWFLRG